jgi:ESCRT-I complex subunit VPS28
LTSSSRDCHADLYSIIKATEKLERAYVRDAIPPGEYERLCERMIQQYKVLSSSLKSQSVVPDVERFMSENNMSCPMATARLIHSGLPATIEHKATQRTSDPESACVAEVTASFITTMDSLRLNLTAVDQLCPLLQDLMNSMAKVQSLPRDFEPKQKIRDAYHRLYQKPATYQLPEDDVRQLLYELEGSYSAFLSSLKNR